MLALAKWMALVYFFSRDGSMGIIIINHFAFMLIKNTIQANILAAIIENRDALNQVYNVAVGDRTTLNQLFNGI